MILFKGLEFHTRYEHPRHGEGFIVERDKFSGWLNSPAIESEEIQRLGDGSFDVPDRFAARSVKVGGTVRARSMRKLLTYADNFSALRSRELEVLTVELGGVSRWAHARVVRQPRFELVSSPLPRARFEVEFWCPDPWIFGEGRVYRGASQPRQYGTVPAYPVVRFTGDFSAGFRLVVGGGGGTFEYLKPASGAVLDTRSMALTSSSGQLLHTFSGAPPVVRPYDPAPAWWSVDAKGKTGVIEVTVADTYI